MGRKRDGTRLIASKPRALFGLFKIRPSGQIAESSSRRVAFLVRTLIVNSSAALLEETRT